MLSYPKQNQQLQKNPFKVKWEKCVIIKQNQKKDSQHWRKLIRITKKLENLFYKKPYLWHSFLKVFCWKQGRILSTHLSGMCVSSSSASSVCKSLLHAPTSPSFFEMSEQSNQTLANHNREGNREINPIRTRGTDATGAKRGKTRIKASHNLLWFVSWLVKNKTLLLTSSVVIRKSTLHRFYEPGMGVRERSTTWSKMKSFSLRDFASL